MTNLMIHDVIEGFGIQVQDWTMPTWDTRPSNPKNGTYGYNTTSEQFETYIDGAWRSIEPITQGVVKPITTITSSSVALGDHNFTILCDTSSNNITVNLPSGSIGKIYNIKKINASNMVTVTPNGADTIDGAASFSLTTNGESVTIQKYSGGWVIN